MLQMLLSPAGKAVGGLLAAAALYAGAYAHGRVDGRALANRDILERLDRENDHAGDTAENWRDAYRRCVDAGGVYDFAAGACER